jgi:glutaminyl-tRNA synthetase
MSDSPSLPSTAVAKPTHFLADIVASDQAAGRYEGQVVTRFPPEPNGYLHIGHAKAICTSFILGQSFGGRCHLRFDDTNPETESDEFVRSIQGDVRWLGFDWGEHLYFASDFFETMFELAIDLIERGLAYVDSQSGEEIRSNRGTVTQAGTHSPFRDRSVAENLELFHKMRAGDFANGAHVLRAKGDMAAANMKLRDPLLYRIRNTPHHRQGAKWCIYPMYDFAHPLEDALEGVTHSICTLEFENNRDIYDWVIDNVDQSRLKTQPKQYEFARLNIGYTVMSKRMLRQLVEKGHVAGWDDPRMPTIAGMRRRGIRPQAVRHFVERVGLAKANSQVDAELLDGSIRDDLNFEAPRVMCVTDPLPVEIRNLPEGQVEWLDASYWPHDVPKTGSRQVPFTRNLAIEREDFAEVPPKKWRRLSPGAEVRLRYGFFIRCEEVIKGPDGKIEKLICSYDPKTRGGDSADGRKVQGTLHWVSADKGVPCELRVYDRLFRVENPGADRDFLEDLNPENLRVTHGIIEPAAASSAGLEEQRFQFERQGYYWADPVDSSKDALVFNRIVGLKSSWSKPALKTPAKPKAQSKPKKQKVGKRPELSPELAAAAAALQALGAPKADAEILVSEATLAPWFTGAVAAGATPKTASSLVVNELRRAAGDTPLDALVCTPEQLAELCGLLDAGKISSKGGKAILAVLVEKGGSASALMAELGLEQISDPAVLRPMVEKVLADNQANVDAYRGGQKGLRGFFVGQAIRATGGKGDPKVLQALLTELLG